MSHHQSSSATAWLGSDSYVRLYHAVANFDNMLQEALSEKEISVSAAMNDELTYHKWSRVMELFNDKSWICKSLFVPSLHPDFNRIRDLKPLTRAETVRDLFDRFQKAKSQMVALRTWCLNDKLVNSEEKKKITALSLMKSNKKDETFSSMSAFPSHLLYLWHYDDTYKALDSLYSLPRIVKGQKGTSKSIADDDEDTGTTTVAKGVNAIILLQNAEAHHLQLANNFGYVLSKLNVTGGRHHVVLEQITVDLAERVEAAHERVLNLERVITE